MARTGHPNSMAARIRRCPRKIFWRLNPLDPTDQRPDYNAVLVWYVQSFVPSPNLRALAAPECPKLPTIQRCIAYEASRRRDGGEVES